jgi:hypothetical protein
MKETLPRADSPQAPGGGDETRDQQRGLRGREGPSGHQRGYVPPLENEVRLGKLLGGQIP